MQTCEVHKGWAGEEGGVVGYVALNKIVDPNLYSTQTKTGQTLGL